MQYKKHTSYVTSQYKETHVIMLPVDIRYITLNLNKHFCVLFFRFEFQNKLQF